MAAATQRQQSESGFYQGLESFSDFAAIAELRYYKPAPDDWFVIITDIKGSTDAIAQGRYKDVNTVGAACITAALNVTSPQETPFVFGGDGATIRAAAEAWPRIREALLKTRALAASGFGLTLRIGAVPVRRLRDAGADVLVAKFALTPGNNLAVFAGGGVGMAERLLKGDDGTQGYLLADEAASGTPDLEGLSCRWEPFKAERGIMMSMLVHALAADRGEAAKTYKLVLDGLNETLGSDTQQHRPVKPTNMRFRWPPRGLRAEALANQGKRGYLPQLLFVYGVTFLQWLLNRFDWKAGRFDPPVYRESLRKNCDYRRFEDTLRILFDCTAEEAAALEARLVKFREQGLIAYGLHRADSALMTCLVFGFGDSEHVHFIDGNDGGFAMAAVQLKKQYAEDAQRASAANV
jgi:hypothetical protein